MPVFRASATVVAAEGIAGTLAGRMAAQFPYETGRRAPDAEVRSWAASLPVLASDLVAAGLGAVEMLLEYQLPLSSKRVDAVLAGVHPRTGRPSFVLVELKQWSSAEAADEGIDLCYVPSYGHRPVLHPVEQVRRYCRFLSDFSRAFEAEPDAFAGAAYLHNATEFGVASLRELAEDSFGRLFTRDRRAAFQSFLASRLAPAGGAEVADRLLASEIAPSRQLMSLAAEEVRDREQFVLLDEQQVAYRLVMTAVDRARRGDSKQVIVVTGGPGSGKSVIALAVLGELWRQGRSALHATGSKSFTETLRRVAGYRDGRVKGLFKYFNSFMVAERNGLDVLICDEAHRIRETSVNRYTKAQLRTDKPQVMELIDAARVPVFLLDQHQVVRPGELGSVDVVVGAARERGLPVVSVDLDAQFRCGGSRRYEEWVERLLGLTTGEPVGWDGDGRFVVEIVDSPHEMESILQDHLDAGYGARMTAGFCWPWHDPRPDGTLVPDVAIGDWSRPWNVKGERAVGGAPPSSLWATDPAGFGQVGCIYTAQGFEYDWNGVILGPDLVWRDGRWAAQRLGSKDPAFRGMSDAAAGPFLRNVYKVLLTRGMAGTLLYSTDPETQEHLRSLVLAPDVVDPTTGKRRAGAAARS